MLSRGGLCTSTAGAVLHCGNEGAGDSLPGLAEALEGLGALAAVPPPGRNAVADFSHSLVNTLAKSALIGGAAAATAEVLAHKQQAHGALLQALQAAGLLEHGAAAPPVRPPHTRPALTCPLPHTIRISHVPAGRKEHVHSYCELCSRRRPVSPNPGPTCGGVPCFGVY